MLDKIIIKYLDDHYSVSHNLMYDKVEDTPLLPIEAENTLMKVFSTNRDVTHITLYTWLYSKGMVDISENWYRLKSVDMEHITGDIAAEFLENLASTYDADYNYEFIDG